MKSLLVTPQNKKKTINNLGANYQKADTVSKCFDSVSPTSVDNTTAP